MLGLGKLGACHHRRCLVRKVGAAGQQLGAQSALALSFVTH